MERNDIDKSPIHRHYTDRSLYILVRYKIKILIIVVTSQEKQAQKGLNRMLALQDWKLCT